MKAERQRDACAAALGANATAAKRERILRRCVAVLRAKAHIDGANTSMLGSQTAFGASGASANGSANVSANLNANSSGNGVRSVRAFEDAVVALTRARVTVGRPFRAWAQLAHRVREQRLVAEAEDAAAAQRAADARRHGDEIERVRERRECACVSLICYFWTLYACLLVELLVPAWFSIPHCSSVHSHDRILPFPIFSIFVPSTLTLSLSLSLLRIRCRVRLPSCNMRSRPNAPSRRRPPNKCDRRCCAVSSRSMSKR